MTFSYDVGELDTELNRIRLEISDTNSEDPLLQNEEIAQVQLEETSFYKRVAKCCQLITSKFTREAKVKIDGYSEDPSGIYERYLGMYEKYSSMSSCSYPWAGSVSITEKDNVETDTDKVVPKIKMGMHDYT